MPPLQTNAQPAPTVAGGAQLHRFLGAGLSVVAAVFVAMTLLVPRRCWRRRARRCR